MDKNIIPIAFATDDNYFPYMAVSIQSVVENADTSHTFKIYVLCQTLREEYKELLQKQVEPYKNFSIEYLDVSKYFEKYVLKSVRLKYTINTFFRLIIPYIFTNYKQVIWLDVDTVCLTNVADLLLNTNEDYMLKGIRDIGTMTILRKYPARVGVRPYHDYFSAGILVLNVEAFSKNVTFDDIMQCEQQKKLKYGDQDLLNIVCKKKVQYESMDWNCIVKSKVYKNPKIIHYVWDKPWKSFYKTSRGKYFWSYAKQTPFYGIVLEKHEKKSLKNLTPLIKYCVVSLFAKFLSANKTINNF